MLRDHTCLVIIMNDSVKPRDSSQRLNLKIFPDVDDECEDN